MLVIIYNLLKNQDVFNEQKFEIIREKQESIRVKRVKSDAKKLGYILVPLEEVS
jgi:hypothetical protein